jgi:hypothetical protein
MFFNRLFVYFFNSIFLTILCLYDEFFKMVYKGVSNYNNTRREISGVYIATQSLFIYKHFSE